MNNSSIIVEREVELFIDIKNLLLCLHGSLVTTFEVFCCLFGLILGMSENNPLTMHVFIKAPQETQICTLDFFIPLKMA